MDYNKHSQLKFNDQWIEGDTSTEVSEEDCLSHNNNMSVLESKNDEETSEEEGSKNLYCKRRNLGKRGNRITVTINYVSVSITDPSAIVFHYKVRIEPEPNKIKLSRKVFEISELEKFPNSISAFDGRHNLYTRKPISAYKKDATISESVNVISEENVLNTIQRFNAIQNRNFLPTSWVKFQSSSYKECKSITANISALNIISLWDEEVLAKRSFKISAQLNEILKYNEAQNASESASCSGVLKEVVEAVETIVGENAFKKCQEKKLTKSGDILFIRHSDPVGNIAGGINLHFGFRQTIVKRPLHRNLFMAIDLTYGCFFDTLPVVDFISVLCKKPKSFFKTSSLEPWELQIVKTYLKGVRIVYHDPGYAMTNREHIVSDVAASAETIRITFGPPGSFNNLNRFYALGKGYALEYPKMPCLVVGPPGMMLGLPSELCTIADGQIFNKKMTNVQKEALKELLLELKPEPRLIKNEIFKLIGALGLERNKLFSDFDIKINKNLIQTNGRVLKPPTLVCKSRMCSGIKQVVPLESSWELEHFEDAVTIEKWAICSVDPLEDPDLQFLSTALRFRGLRLGMKIDEPKLFPHVVLAEEDLEKDFEIFLKDRKAENCEVVIVVMPSSGAFYGKIKRIAELQVGILTQCLKSSTVKNLDLSIMNNLLLKLNAKLNGNSYNIKSSLWPKYFIRPVLVVGAYVNVNDHYQNSAFPFIASIVGNYNKHATKHSVIWSFMKSDSHCIANLDMIIGELINRYWKISGMYPEKILYYRDGISEETLSMVVEKEVEMIRKGCFSLHPLYQPSLTYIDVTRNHPTMFLPTKQGDVPAGTVVDSTIAHPDEIEFFLMSNISYLGTPRPTKYHVLIDESHLSEDDIQEITYYLCHLSCRCTRSVPFPVQLYYARLATHRAQKYLERNFIDEEEIDKTINDILNVNALLQNNPMFFV